MPKSAGTVCFCALLAGTLSLSAEAQGQERAAPSTQSRDGVGASMMASATILPSLDAASFGLRAADLPEPLRRRRLVATPTRAPEGPRGEALPRDPPLARSFERLAYGDRSAVRHTIAVLY
ncbi:MAG: hypothetical protein AB7T31_04585 [Gemmatimonadales bacterium]